MGDAAWGMEERFAGGQAWVQPWPCWGLQRAPGSSLLSLFFPRHVRGAPLGSHRGLKGLTGVKPKPVHGKHTAFTSLHLGSITFLSLASRETWQKSDK